MSKSLNDRNLLMGMLALLLDLITQPSLITAMQAWMLSKSVPIEDALLQQKAITEDEKLFLTALAQKHLTLHSNGAEESLAALSSISSVRMRLTELDDEEIEQTLSMVSEIKGNRIPDGQDGGPHATTITSGSALSGGRFPILRPHAQGDLG